MFARIKTEPCVRAARICAAFVRTHGKKNGLKLILLYKASVSISLDLGEFIVEVSIRNFKCSLFLALIIPFATLCSD